MRSGRSGRFAHVDRSHSFRSACLTVRIRAIVSPGPSTRYASSSLSYSRLLKIDPRVKTSGIATTAIARRTGTAHACSAGRHERRLTSSCSSAAVSHAIRIACGTEGSARRASSGLRRKPAFRMRPRSATVAIFGTARGNPGRKASREIARTASAKSGRAISR